MKKIILVFILCVISSTIYAQEELSILDIITELEELSSIQEERRTIDDWKRIIELIIYIAENENISFSEILDDLQEEIKKYDSMIKNLEDLQQEHLTLIEERNTYLKQLIELKENYEKMIDDLTMILKEDRTIEIQQYNNIFISPSICINGNINISINYMTNIDNFLVGGGIISSINPFNIGICLHLGLRF